MNRRHTMIEEIKRKLTTMDESELKDMLDQMKGESNPGYIPDWLLLKDANQTIGQLKSELDEKEYEIKKLKKELEEMRKFESGSDELKNVRKDIKKEEMYTSLKQINDQLRKKLKENKADMEKLIIEISKLRAKQ